MSDRKHSIRKGDLVRVVRKVGTVPMGYAYWATYVLSEEQRDELRADPAYRGLDDAGEPLVVPRTAQRLLEAGELLIVERARAAHPDGSHRRPGDWVRVLHTGLGRTLWARSCVLEPAGAEEKK